MNVPEDPYFSGRVASEPGPFGWLGHQMKPLDNAWVAVFLINLIVPLLLAWWMTEQAGRVGMCLALVFLLVIGCGVINISRKFAIGLLAGGGLVAITQVVPVLQILAGLIGIVAAQILGQVSQGEREPFGHLNSEFGGFIATMFTGGLLMTVALAVGLLMIQTQSLPASWTRRERPDDPKSGMVKQTSKPA